MVLIGNERVGLEHRFELLTRVDRLFPDLGERFEAACDLTVVTGDQDRFDACEVLVQRRKYDAGLRGDLRHCYRP
jgi:hypothetical protein